AIVNETLARTFWGTENPIGKRLRADNGRWMEVVGLVGDSKYVTMGEGATSFLYRPLAQDYLSEVTLLVRTHGDPMTILPTVRATLRSLDRELPLFNVSGLDPMTAISLLPVKVAATVSGALGAVALALAAIGLYGVMSFLVRQRTAEIGTR